MTYRSLFTLWVTFCLFSSCASSKKEAPAETPVTIQPVPQPYKKIAQEKYQTHVEYDYNSKKTHVICLQKSQGLPTKPQLALRFFIYDLETDKVVYEDSQPNGKIKWIEADKVEVTTMPGIVRGDEGKEPLKHGYIFDVTNGKKMNRNAPSLEK